MNVNTQYSTSSTNPTTAPGGTPNLDTTFMSLLVAELKSQDPTSPMDATQMVAQMVSLNQLDQLIKIQSLLSDRLGSAGVTESSVSSQQGD